MTGQGKNWEPNLLTTRGFLGQSAMPTTPRQSVTAGRANGLMLRGIVANVYVYDAEEGYTTTDVDSPTLNTIYADVLLISGGMLPRCEVLQERSGLQEGSIWIPRATTLDVTGAEVNAEFATNPYNLDGDHVVVGFLDDDLAQPVILGCLPHPNSDIGRTAELDDLGLRMRLVNADGQPRLWKHRGGYFGLDKDGNWLLDLTEAHEGQYEANGAEPDPKEDGTSGNITVRTQAGTTLFLEMGSNASLQITEANGKVILANTGDTDIQTDGDVAIGTGASEHLVLGDTWDGARGTMNAKLATAVTAIETFVAAWFGIVAPPTGTPPVAFPAYLAAITPFITTLNTALTAAGAGAGITAFEGGDYLSDDVTTK